MRQQVDRLERGWCLLYMNCRNCTRKKTEWICWPQLLRINLRQHLGMEGMDPVVNVVQFVFYLWKEVRIQLLYCCFWAARLEAEGPCVSPLWTVVVLVVVWDKTPQPQRVLPTSTPNAAHTLIMWCHVALTLISALVMAEAPWTWDSREDAERDGAWYPLSWSCSNLCYTCISRKLAFRHVAVSVICVNTIHVGVFLLDHTGFLQKMGGANPSAPSLANRKKCQIFAKTGPENVGKGSSLVADRITPPRPTNKNLAVLLCTLVWRNRRIAIGWVAQQAFAAPGWQRIFCPSRTRGSAVALEFTFLCILTWIHLWIWFICSEVPNYLRE